MNRRLLSLSIMGALALSSLPAFAEDAASSDSASSMSSSSTNAASVSSASASSAKSARNLGQAIKQNCAELTGRSREQCVKSTIVNRKVTGIVKKAVKHTVKVNCNEHIKGTPEFHACVQEQKTIVKDAVMVRHPKGKMVEKTVKKGKGGASSAE